MIASIVRSTYVDEDSSSNPEALHESPAEHSHSHGGRDKTSRQPTEFDVDKLRSTLKQIVRDWSEEVTILFLEPPISYTSFVFLQGKVERDACYEPIKEALTRHFANTPEEDRRNVQVLVPGTGLGRLSYEVARLGFTCQGNEFSHYMLLVSHFVLNRTRTINQYAIYPYIHSFSNIPQEPALLRSVSIPDILPSDLPSECNFSLVAGDFEEIYGVTDEDDHSGRWNAILTCFFIDTAKNIINYLKIFHKILASGGVWINLGPLLWHWENNMTNDTSIELDLEQVKQLAREIGFEISNERTIDTTYTNNGESMLGYVYHASFWVAIRK